MLASVETALHKNEQLETFSFQTGLLGILILIVSVVISATATCWPLHNVIEQPEYWYEPVFQIMVTRLLPLAGKNIVEINLLIKTKSILSWKSFFQHYAFLSTGHTVLFITEYIIWVHMLGYQPPMPFHGQLHLGLMYFLIIPFSIWTLFPSHLKEEQQILKRQIISYVFLFKFRGAIGILYSKLPAIFFMKKVHMEWVLVIFLPILKKIIVKIHRKLVMRVTNGDKITSSINTIITIGYIHSFSLTLLLGSRNIDFSTSCMMIVSDFGLNTWCLFVKILKSGQRRNPFKKEGQNQLLKNLALKEFLEVLVPSIFCLSFAIAYNGPSAELIGNIKGNCWTFQKVDNLTQKLSKILIFIAIDAFRAVFFGLLLWHFCKQNIYADYCSVTKKYGLLITLFGSNIINGYYLSSMIWSASDTTYQFNWIYTTSNKSREIIFMKDCGLNKSLTLN